MDKMDVDYMDMGRKHGFTIIFKLWVLQPLYEYFEY